MDDVGGCSVGFVLNGRDASERQRTYIILGTRRGGTSSVAGVAAALGLDLGIIGNNKNNEDPRFQHKDMNRMREIVGRRNKERDVWGWKFPAAGHYLPALWNVLRNPYLIVVNRDAVAAAVSQYRHDNAMVRRPLRLSLAESNTNTNASIEIALGSLRPVMFISHELAKSRPVGLIEDVANFLQVPVPGEEMREQLLKYLRPDGKYKEFGSYFETLTD